MIPAQPQLEWQILEDPKDERWSAAVRPSLGPDNRRPVSTVIVSAATFGILIAIVALTSVLYHRASRNLAQIEHSLDSLVAVEEWAQQHHPTDLSDTWIDPEAPAAWKSTAHAAKHDDASLDQSQAVISGYELAAGWAYVRVRTEITDENGIPSVLLEPRFYRLTETGWLRSVPQPAFWGDVASADSEYFTFTYRRRDAHAVQEVLAEIDSQYAHMRSAYGLAPLPAGKKLHIYVQPNTLPSTDPGLFRFVDDQLMVTSPLQMPGVPGMDETDILRASILEPLAATIADENMCAGRNAGSWQPLRDGIQLWLQEEHAGLPSGYRRQMRSLLHEWPDIETPQLSFLTAYNADSPGVAYADNSNAVRQAAAWALVSYAADAYGAPSIMSLMDAMQEHESWDELIPAVYGVPAAQFEAGWQTYLAELSQ